MLDKIICFFKGHNYRAQGYFDDTLTPDENKEFCWRCFKVKPEQEER